MYNILDLLKYQARRVKTWGIRSSLCGGGQITPPTRALARRINKKFDIYQDKEPISHLEMVNHMRHYLTIKTRLFTKTVYNHCACRSRYFQTNAQIYIQIFLLHRNYRPSSHSPIWTILKSIGKLKHACRKRQTTKAIGIY